MMCEWEEIQKSCLYCSNLLATDHGVSCELCLEIYNGPCEKFSLQDSGYGGFEPFAWPALRAYFKGISVSAWNYPQDGNFMVFE